MRSLVGGLTLLARRGTWRARATLAQRSRRGLARHARSPITARETDYSQWYLDVIREAELVDRGPVAGTMVLRPDGMALWEQVQEQLGARIRASGARNAYFPLLIPQSFLSREAQHVEGFAQECAVVTHHRLRRAEPNPFQQFENNSGGTKASALPTLEPDPEAQLSEPLVVRPTSETMIWHMLRRWLGEGSKRALPLKLNQWGNVVRWELRTRPFLRSSEFLWQEGHTAHASAECALGTAREMQGVYADFCRDVLAVPVVKGEKSTRERFAGAEQTLTIEAMMQNGWALQSGTSHYLGQNFARAFDVTFQDPARNGQRTEVWATSWGVSTRLLGALVMTHADDRGLCLPPRFAPRQVVLVPLGGKRGSNDEAALAAARALCKKLVAAGVRAEVDDRTDIRPGAKFFEIERAGVPLRIDVGRREVERGVATLMPRVDERSLVTAGEGDGDGADRAGDGAAEPLEISLAGDEAVDAVQALLEVTQEAMLLHATARLERRTVAITKYAEMKSALAQAGMAGEGDDMDIEADAGRAGDGPAFFLAPWRDDPTGAREEEIQRDCKATLRCFPDSEPQGREELGGASCFFSGEEADRTALFARAY